MIIKWIWTVKKKIKVFKEACLEENMSKAYNLSLTWIIDSNVYKKRVKLSLCDVFVKLSW